MGQRAELTGDAKARLSLGALARSLGAAVAMDGIAAVDLTLSGALARPVVAGRIGVERLDIAGMEARDLSASLRLDDQALAVTDVAGRLFGGRLQGSLTVPARRPNETLVRLRLDGAEAGALARLGGEGSTSAAASPSMARRAGTSRGRYHSTARSAWMAQSCHCQESWRVWARGA